MVIHLDVTLSKNDRPNSYSPQLISISGTQVEGCECSNNLAVYLGYCSKELYDERVLPIRQSMEDYNRKVSFLWGLEGFGEFFAEHGYLLTKEALEEAYGQEAVNCAFSIKAPKFCIPDVVSSGDTFWLRSVQHTAMLTLNDQEYTLPLTGKASDYPAEINGKICLWNWVEGGTDFAMNFVLLFEQSKLPSKAGLRQPSWDDCYDQWRGKQTPDVELINRIFDALEERGYLQRYRLFPSSQSDIWSYYTATSDHSVGLYLLDKKAFKDKLLISRMNALIEACTVAYDSNNNMIYGTLVDPVASTFNLDQKFFYLQDKNNIAYISKKPGCIGGHYKLKIYGKLDCPSALWHIEKGNYIKHRVFFADEETAIAAGYRPCSVCCPKEYEQWKSLQKE